VTGSTYLFDQQVARFLATLAPLPLEVLDSATDDGSDHVRQQPSHAGARHSARRPHRSAASPESAGSRSLGCDSKSKRIPQPRCEASSSSRCTSYIPTCSTMTSTSSSSTGSRSSRRRSISSTAARTDPLPHHRPPPRPVESDFHGPCGPRSSPTAIVAGTIPDGGIPSTSAVCARLRVRSPKIPEFFHTVDHLEGPARDHRGARARS